MSSDDDFFSPTDSSSADSTPDNTVTSTNTSIDTNNILEVKNQLETAQQTLTDQREKFKEEAAVVDPRMSDNNRILRGGVTGTAMLTGKVSQHLMRSKNWGSKTVGAIGAGAAGTLGFLGDAATQQLTAGEVDWGQAAQHGVVAAAGGGTIAAVGQKMHTTRVAAELGKLNNLFHNSKASGKLADNLKDEAKNLLLKNPKANITSKTDQLTAIGKDQDDVRQLFTGLEGNKKAALVQQQALAKIDAGDASKVNFLDLQKQAESLKLGQQRAELRKQLLLTGNFDTKNPADSQKLTDLVFARLPKDPTQAPLSDAGLQAAIAQTYKKPGFWPWQKP